MNSGAFRTDVAQSHVPRANFSFFENVCARGIKLRPMRAENVPIGMRFRKGANVKHVVFLMAVMAMAGCAQLHPADTANAEKPAAPTAVMRFDIPADALGARDPQLATVLAKAGALAAAQKQPTVIRVTALGQDLRYLNEAIWKGVPPRQSLKPALENVTAGANQTYSVSIEPLQSGD